MKEHTHVYESNTYILNRQIQILQYKDKVRNTVLKVQLYAWMDKQRLKRLKPEDSWLTKG